MANRFEVAHIQEQGVDLIIIPLKPEFQHKTAAEQNQTVGLLQVCATRAGLRGTVVPVWDAGGGRMGFRAPQNWHPFFASLSLEKVAMSINRELTCG